MSLLISDAQGNILFEVRFKQKTVTWWNIELFVRKCKVFNRISLCHVIL